MIENYCWCSVSISCVHFVIRRLLLVVYDSVAITVAVITTSVVRWTFNFIIAWTAWICICALTLFVMYSYYHNVLNEVQSLCIVLCNVKTACVIVCACCLWIKFSLQHTTVTEIIVGIVSIRFLCWFCINFYWLFIFCVGGGGTVCW